MRLHVIPHSTNVDRVSLALGLKGRTAERVLHPTADRSGVRAVSGQDLVPVLETPEGGVLPGSMAIVDWIDATWPDPPLYPAGAAGRREVEGFVTFFDHLWKVAPNAIADGTADAAGTANGIAQLRGWRHGFEALLTGRDFLFGDAPGAADVCAHPFLRYATSSDPGDDDLFHGVLIEHLALDGAFPNLAAWIARVAALPHA
ncbi:glutathione S-transferase family protein [Baekduia soli]|nr:glutathione S-transferase family protein [Baekduia soli]